MKTEILNILIKNIEEKDVDQFIDNLNYYYQEILLFNDIDIFHILEYIDNLNGEFIFLKPIFDIFPEFELIIESYYSSIYDNNEINQDG